MKYLENQPLKIAIINDLHFGIKDSERLYNELSLFTDYISNDENKISLIIFNGDYFDCKLSVGDLATYYAVSFFQQVLTICKEKEIAIRMIQGTRSHELNQLSLFDPFTLEDVDFRIIQNVCDEMLFGKHFLYIPEEYPEDCDEYYKDFKTKKYDMIFGHGTWDFIGFGAERLAKKGIRSAPVFIYDEWKDTIPDGLIVFGHIHGRNIYKDKIYYPGSFTRWSYGERGPRGFSVVTIDTENKATIELIDNTIAPNFDTLSVKELDVDLINTQTDDLIKILNEHISKADNLRIDLSGLPQEKIDVIKKNLENTDGIKLEVRENRSMLKESSDSEKFKKFEYITKKQLPLDKTIQKYCSEELNVSLTLDEIDKILKKEA